MGESSLKLDFSQPAQQPITITRWKNGAPIKINVVPTPFGKNRAEEIRGQIKYFWEEVSAHMTDGELAYVDSLYMNTEKYRTWMDAFFAILDG